MSYFFYLGLLAAQLRHQLAKNSIAGSQRAKALKELKGILNESNMFEYATFCTETVNDLNLSKGELETMKGNNAKKLADLQKEIDDAEGNLGEIEVLEANKKLAAFYYLTNTKEKALGTYDKVGNLKGMSTGQKIDNNLKKVLLGLFWKDFELLQVTLEECDRLMEIGGDWERRNRLRVYRGVFNMLQRNFEKASEDLLSTVATFTCTELCPYNQFIFYAVVTSIIALDRVEFKKKVIDSSQVKAVYSEFEWLPTFVHCLHDADYSSFFLSVSNLFPMIEADRFLHDHAKWWVRELRIKTYSQFLEPFKSVTLEMMSYEFGLSQKFLDKELSRFIAAGKVQAKIDKANGVVETMRQTKSNVQYQEVLKQGDLLLNKVQQLSRLLGV